MKPFYIIYDQRAYSEGTDVAAVLSCANSLKEARRDVREMFPGSPIFGYDQDTSKTPPQLINEWLVE